MENHNLRIEQLKTWILANANTVIDFDSYIEGLLQGWYESFRSGVPLPDDIQHILENYYNKYLETLNKQEQTIK